jgi:hypothetical protein
MPSDEDLYRFGMACRAGKPAACRELALIFLHDEPDTSCGTWATDDPNGPVTGSPGHEDKPACKPPEYRHLGPCGECDTPRISCGYSQQPGKSVGGGSPFGHPSSKCPRGEWCSSFGVCIPKSDFPVEHRNLARDKTCYVDRECASGECALNGVSTFGSVGTCR